MASWLGEKATEFGPNKFPFDSDWEDKNWRNVPGPFYGTGRAFDEERRSTLVVTDAHGDVFLWRQPETEDEVVKLAEQAYGDDGNGLAFASDGDLHWTIEGVREWWSRRALLAAEYRAANVPIDLVRYFEVELPQYLRAYAFFLVEGRRPRSDASLPEIDRYAQPPISRPSILTEPIDDAVAIAQRADQILSACGVEPGRFPFIGRPVDAHALNVPGFFRIGLTSGAENAVKLARANLAYDEDGAFFYRQPRTPGELDDVLDVALAYPFSISIGNLRLTSTELGWWQRRFQRFKKSLAKAAIFDASALVEFLHHDLPSYLKRYIFFLKNKRLPNAGELLPDVGPPSVPKKLVRRGVVFHPERCLPLTIGVTTKHDASVIAFEARFADRHPHNVPGPVYAAGTSPTGTVLAEWNLARDRNGRPFVYRQPYLLDELDALVEAIEAAPADHYNMDGNDHWTPELVRAWWRERDAHIVAWEAAKIGNVPARFAHQVDPWLRGYLFFLENGRPWSPEDSWPELEP